MVTKTMSKAERASITKQVVASVNKMNKDLPPGGKLVIPGQVQRPAHAPEPAFDLPAKTKEVKSLIASTIHLGKKTKEVSLQLGNLFIEIKREVGHGKWGPWLVKEKINQRTAEHYMAMAENPDKYASSPWDKIEGSSNSTAAAKAKEEPFTVEALRKANSQTLVIVDAIRNKGYGKLTKEDKNLLEQEVETALVNNITQLQELNPEHVCSKCNLIYVHPETT